MSALGVRAFPWARFARVTRAAIEARHALRVRLGVTLGLARLEEILARALGEGTTAVAGALVEVQEVGTAGGDRCASDGVVVQWPVIGLRCHIRPEPELLRLSVARLLGEEFELGWADAGMDATLRGAGAALVLDICRQLSRGEAPELSGPLGEPCVQAFGCRLTVHVRGKPYAVVVELEATSGGLASGCQMLAGRLEALGAVPIALPWVCAVSEATVGLVQMLSVGDVWLPGDGWVDASDPLSAGVLALPLANSGLPVRVSAGRTVLGPQPLPVHPQLELSMNQDPSDVEQIVSEAPLVVRLEVGSLEMSATEWAALRPGDVVQSGRRIEEAVILRCAGREIARGELVEVEGEIGVRVTHVGGSSAHA